MKGHQFWIVHPKLSSLAKFQVFSTFGRILSRALNFTIFHEKHLFSAFHISQNLGGRGGGGGGRSFYQILSYAGKDKCFYQIRLFSNGQKNSFIAPIDLKFCILTQLSIENPNLKSIFSWDLLEILIVAN